jgi:uncharacterized membrane protein
VVKTPIGECASVEYVVSAVLFWGGMISVVLVVAGMALHLRSDVVTADVGTLSEIRSSQETGPAAGAFLSVREIGHSLITRPMDALALVSLGLSVLSLTPVVGVAVALLAFVKTREYRYVAISSLVLTILVASFFVVAT